MTSISIHAPHTGRDYYSNPVSLGAIQISIHAPHTGRDFSELLSDCVVKPFQSTRPIRGATPVHPYYSRQGRISIHAPHTGRDTSSVQLPGATTIFQSTRPIRGATAKMHNLCSAFLQ